MASVNDGGVVTVREDALGIVQDVSCETAEEYYHQVLAGLNTKSVEEIVRCCLLFFVIFAGFLAPGPVCCSGSVMEVLNPLRGGHGCNPRLGVPRGEPIDFAEVSLHGRDFARITGRHRLGGSLAGVVCPFATTHFFPPL